GISSLSCSVRYTPAETGAQTVTAAYPGDTLHSGSGGAFALNVVARGDDGGVGALAVSGAPAMSSPGPSLAVPPAFAFGTLLTVVASSIVSRVRAHRSRSAPDDRLH